MLTKPANQITHWNKFCIQVSNITVEETTLVKMPLA